MENKSKELGIKFLEVSAKNESNIKLYFKNPTQDLPGIQHLSPPKLQNSHLKNLNFKLPLN